MFPYTNPLNISNRCRKMCPGCWFDGSMICASVFQVSHICSMYRPMFDMFPIFSSSARFPGYPLVICYIAMENHHLEWMFPLKLVILHSYVTNCQRVNPITVYKSHSTTIFLWFSCGFPMVFLQIFSFLLPNTPPSDPI